MYRDRREWADRYTAQVLAILNTLISHLAVLSIASDETDRKYATDLEVKLIGGTIAVRVRKPCRFRDLTLRALLASGTKTELAKIKEGYAFRYFYAWTDARGNIAEWMLLDLDKLRQSDVLNQPYPLRPNGDGTSFIAIPLETLRRSGCVIACLLNKEAA